MPTPVPQSSVEQYLSVIAGHSTEVPSEPTSRVEWYLNEIVVQGGIGGKLKPKPVPELPAVGESGILYLVPIQDTSGQNTHNEYLWVEEESKYELLGQAKIEIDLSHYVEDTRKVGNVPLSSDIPVTLTGDSAITVTNTGTASAIGYNVAHNDSGVTAGSKGDTTDQTPGFGDTFKVLFAIVDAKGHVTALEEHTTKIPDAEATQSAKGLMSHTDKEKLDTLVDGTLSNEGKAADAKATGNKIAELKAQNALFREYFANMEVYRTASGNPMTFSDAKAANVKELLVTLTPTQSGSGDPYPPGGGKNLLELEDAVTTVNGVTFTSDKTAGTVTANGLATADYTRIFVRLNLPAGSYILSGCPAGGGDNSYRQYLYNQTNSGYVGGSFDYGQPGERAFTIDADSTIDCFIDVSKDYNASNLVFRPMIRRATDTDPTFAPYSNIRPISSATSASVTRTGKNLAPMYLGTSLNNGISYSLNADGSLRCAGTVPNGGISSFSGSNYYSYQACPWHFPAGTYTITTSGFTDNDRNISSLSFLTFRKSASSSVTTCAGMVNESRTVTIDEPFGAWFWVTVRARQTVNQNVCIQIGRGSAASDYEPYRGETVTVNLVDSNSDPLTVYGGTLNVTTGELTVTWADIASYNGETLPGVWMSDRDVYAENAMPTTGAQVVYELAAPVVYQLAPAQLATLSGYNSVTTDAGTLSVTYRADPTMSSGGAT